MDKYLGYEECHAVDGNELIQFYANPKENIFSLRQNEYGLLHDENGNLVDKVKWNGNEYKQLAYKAIKNEFTGKLRPRNIQQELAFDMLQDSNTTVKLLTGTWGSGKTMLMAATALNYVMGGAYDRLVWIRNNYETRDTNAIGHLPGSFMDKMIVWAAPLADHLGGEEGLNRAVNEGQVEIQHLGFIRGRDIKNSIVLCSEAENLTREHMALLLSRIGEGSALWLDGDVAQTDHKKFDTNSGIRAIIDSLAGDPLFGYVHLTKTERSKTAELACKLL